LAAFSTIVARGTRTAVGLVIVVQSQQVGVFLADVLAFFCRAVFHYDDLEVFESLPAEAVKQFVGFLRTVVYGYDDRKTHFQYFLQR
jgi:hypothetical protein